MNLTNIVLITRVAERERERRKKDVRARGRERKNRKGARYQEG